MAGVRRRLRELRVRREARRHPAEHVDDLLERPALADVRLEPADVDADAVRIDDEVRAVERRPADDDLGGADELADLDDRRAAEDGGLGS